MAGLASSSVTSRIAGAPSYRGKGLFSGHECRGRDPAGGTAQLALARGARGGLEGVQNRRKSVSSKIPGNLTSPLIWLGDHLGNRLMVGLQTLTLPV